MGSSMFDYVLAADVLYHEEHFLDLIDTFAALSHHNNGQQPPQPSTAGSASAVLPASSVVETSAAPLICGCTKGTVIVLAYEQRRKDLQPFLEILQARGFQLLRNVEFRINREDDVMTVLRVHIAHLVPCK